MIRLVLVLCLLLAHPARGGEIGTNLSVISDWSTQQPFLDVMKSARVWIGHKPGRWGGVTFEELEAAGVLDAQGWPTHIPSDLASIGTVIMTDLPEQATAYDGRYVLTFEGDGIVGVGGRASNVRHGDNEVRFDVTTGSSGVDIRIERSDPSGSGDYVRNIRIVREEWADRLAAGELFNPIWRGSLTGYDVLRFMDWGETNNSTLSRWEDRPQVSDFTWTRRGAPVEVMLALAAEIGADPWFTLPDMADDAYVRSFAEVVRGGLAADAQVYAEYSNEVWNWQFDQADRAEAAALERWGIEHRWMQYYGLRAAEVAEIWADVFADQRARLVTVISTQTGWLGLEAEALDAPLYVAEAQGNRPPHAAFDAYAVTGYFGYALGTEARGAMVHGWLEASREAAEGEGRAEGLTGASLDAYVADHAYDFATEQAAQELADGSLSGAPEESLSHFLTEVMPYHAEVAEAHGLDLIAYEAGTHVAAVGLQVDDRDLTDFLEHLNYTPEMAALYEKLFAGWEAVTDGPLVLFTDMIAPSKWGSWGTLRYQGDETPRARVIRQAVEGE